MGAGAVGGVFYIGQVGSDGGVFYAPRPLAARAKHTVALRLFLLSRTSASSHSQHSLTTVGAGGTFSLGTPFPHPQATLGEPRLAPPQSANRRLSCQAGGGGGGALGNGWREGQNQDRGPGEERGAYCSLV